LQLNPILVNGSYVLNLGFQYSPDGSGSLQTALGSPATLTVDNPLTLDSSSAAYEGAVNITAYLTFPAISYTVRIYDRDDNLLATLSGTPASGTITANWDGTDGSGNVIASGNLTAAFDLQAAAGASASATAGIIPRDCKCGKDVTKLLYATLSDVAETYYTAPWYKRWLALILMRNGQPWDIEYLKHGDPAIFEMNRSCDPCATTVVFEGQCVHAEELNYMLLGLGLSIMTEEGDMVGSPEEIIGQWAWMMELRFLLNEWGWADGDPDPYDVQIRKLGFTIYAMKLYGLLPQIKVTPAKLRWPWPCKIQRNDRGQLEEAKRTNAGSDAYPQNWYWNGLRYKPAIPSPPPFP
jgi:hypothetical protein